MGRPKGSKNKPKTDKVSLAAKEVPVKIVEQDEEPIVVKKKNIAKEKWDSMSFNERKEIIKSLMFKGFINTRIKKDVNDHFAGRDETNTRFCDLSYDIQDIIINYLKK
jgi:exonuclease I